MKNLNLKKTTSLLIFIFVLSLANIASGKNRPYSPYKKLDIFSKVLSLIEQNHIQNINEVSLIEGAINGMLKSLDPHSSYLNREEFKILREDTNGRFFGVGLEVGMKDGIITVITPLPDSPAIEAGVKAGDIIVKIDNNITSAMDMEEAIMMMRGEKNTQVTISVKRTNVEDLIDIKLTRADIKMQSVETKIIEPGFIHTKIKMFMDGTSKTLKKELKKHNNIKGILLDLRNNPGGLMYEAVKICDLFLSKGTIVTTRGRDQILLEEFNAHYIKTFKDVPIVILINNASASASEIVAGALKDNDRAIIVGTTSFGKGSVQTILPLSDGSGLKLTTALYYTPNGISIQATGVVPDVIIEQMEFPEVSKNVAHEKDLPGHIEQKVAVSNKTVEKLEKSKDYQMTMAYQILKGLAKTTNALSK